VSLAAKHQIKDVLFRTLLKFIGLEYCWPSSTPGHFATRQF